MLSAKPLSSSNDAVELVVVTHVVDAITFWAQAAAEDKAVENMDAVLSEICPAALRLTGSPSSQKLYGACYTGDRCWYRCKVQQQIDDKFDVSYVDYGNAEVVGRSDLVELPVDLQSAPLAKKYKFWGFHLAVEQDTPQFTQGKSFLQNLIYGKNLRINKKSVCFDGTILVQAFQGSLDIGEEVLKFKFARLGLPSNRESLFPAKVLQKQARLWPSRDSQGDCDNPGSLGWMPKLRPVLSNHKPQIMKEMSTNTVLTAEGDLGSATEKQNLNAESAAQQLNGQVTEQMLNEAKSELQRVREAMDQKTAEMEKLEEEKHDLQKHVDDLKQQLTDATLELQRLNVVCERKDVSVEVHMGSTVDELFSHLAQKVEAVRKSRETNESSTAEDLLSECIKVVQNNRTVMPLTSDKLEVAWEDYKQALNRLRDCPSKGELEDLVNIRNQACGVLLSAIDDFLLEMGSLPIQERLDALKQCGSSLMAVFGSASAEDVKDQRFEQFWEWRNQKQQKLRAVRKATDEAMSALSQWAANATKFFSLTETTAVPLESVAVGLADLLKQAESDVCEELNLKHLEQDGEEITSNAFHTVMKHVQKEERELCGLRELYEDNTKFMNDMLKWQNNRPKADELLSIKKRIKSLRSQLRWKVVELGCLEEDEDQDLTEILKKKEEIAETRNTLFQEIRHEKEEYIRICELVKGSFPELVQLYPEADISSYLSSEGLLLKSLDRDIFDAEPMRELSGRRPLLCTEFQAQKVVLKGYSVDKESEVRTLEQATQYQRAQIQNPTAVMPLLGLFFGKSDPMAYFMVPYFSNGSLRAVQRIHPLIPSEIRKVMRGVLKGLQCLHETCIAHASLNPSNVFVLNRERGIVGDFDFTKTPEQRAVDSGMMAGSISLVAQELKQGRPPSPGSDMYAVGGLMLWLHAPDNVESEHQIPEFSKLQLDGKLQKLLLKLLVCSERPSALETLRQDYFLSSEN